MLKGLPLTRRQLLASMAATGLTVGLYPKMALSADGKRVLALAYGVQQRLVGYAVDGGARDVQHEQLGRRRLPACPQEPARERLRGVVVVQLVSHAAGLSNSGRCAISQRAWSLRSFTKRCRAIE